MRAALLACAFLLAAPPTASAEWQIKPFLGLTFGGATTFVDSEQAAGRRHRNLGVSVAWLGNVMGVEGDLGYGPGFFERGDADPEKVFGSSVTTLTGNVMLMLPRRMTRYALRPYFVAGGGLVRVYSNQVVSTVSVDDTLPAIDIGGGATGFLSDHIGVSWDVRYFKSLGGSSGSGLTFGREQLSFWRASMAVAIRTGKSVP